MRRCPLHSTRCLTYFRLLVAGRHAASAYTVVQCLSNGAIHRQETLGIWYFTTEEPTAAAL